MTNDQVEQLRVVEEGLSAAVQQKQLYQKQVVEIEHALEELKETNEAHVIVGSVMIQKDITSLSKELEEKKKMYTLRITTLQKKEDELTLQAQEIQSSLLQED